MTDFFNTSKRKHTYNPQANLNCYLLANTIAFIFKSQASFSSRLDTNFTARTQLSTLKEILIECEEENNANRQIYPRM